MTAPRMRREQIEIELEQLNRAPFRGILSALLDNAPSDEAISKQAERSPEKWAQTVSTIARLTGFTDTLRVDGSIHMRIDEMSDMELEASILSLMDMDHIDMGLRQKGLDVVEHEGLDIPDPPGVA